VDAWHGILISAVTSLTAAVGVLWRQTVTLRRQLDDLHAEHLDDVKELTRETIELAREATYAPPLRRSESLPSG
jgi:hypothetical protein